MKNKMFNSGMIAVIFMIAVVCTASANWVNSGDECGVPQFYENKYTNTDPMYQYYSYDNWGYAVFSTRAHVAQDQQVFYKNVKDPREFVYSYHWDLSPVNSNPGFGVAKIEPDNNSVPVILAKGDYIAYLSNGNGDQVETIPFSVGGGETTKVTFIGASKPI